MELPVNYEDITWQVRKLVREEYTKRQDGRCYYCQQLLINPIHKTAMKLKPINKNLFPKGFFQWPVHLHHNHKTGMTIGSVHNYCNAVLWQYHRE